MASASLTPSLATSSVAHCSSNSFAFPGTHLPSHQVQDVLNADLVNHAFVDPGIDDASTLALGLRNPFKTLLHHRRLLELGPSLRKVLSAYLDSRVNVE
eukprot:6463025-Amphidinium_carterae.1